MFQAGQLCCAFLLWLFCLLFTGKFAIAEYMRGCYLTNWARHRTGRGTFTLSSYPAKMCSHVFYAFAKFNEDFEAESTDPDDLPSAYSVGWYATVTNLKTASPNLKVILSFGGWTFGGYTFGLMASTAKHRKKFITSAIEFTRKYNFDGIDIVWEYPSRNERHTYVIFMKELHDAIIEESEITKKPRLLQTAALPAEKATIDAGFDVSAFHRYLDYLLLMTYDYNGSWNSSIGFNAPLFSKQNDTDETANVAWSMKYYAQLRAPKKKIVMGIPAYGRGWTLKNPSISHLGAPSLGGSPAYPYTQAAGFAAYFELCEALPHEDLRENFDTDVEVPYFLRGTEWMSYDDAESVRIKTDWVVDNGFGGAFVWTLDMDDFSSQCPDSTDYYPLTTTMYEVFHEAETFSETSEETAKTKS